MFTTLIQAPELRALRDTGAPVLVMDCSFDLMNPAAIEEGAAAATEYGGPTGPEPTRYGDWEKKGLAVDF